MICGTVRAFDDGVTRLIRDEMHRICDKVAEGMGVEVWFEIEPDCMPATVNDRREAEFVAGVAESLLGSDGIVRDHPPTMGGEDFAAMLEQRPGAFLFIGNGDSAPLHNAAYDFDDDASPIGAAFWSRLVETALPPR